MNKYMISVATAFLSFVMLVGVTSQASAQSEKKSRPLPFHGTIDSVDTTANTITLAGKESKRVFHVSSDTKMIKHGKPATLVDATPGDVIGGSYTKAADGTLNAISLRFGPKPEKAQKQKDDK